MDSDDLKILEEEFKRCKRECCAIESEMGLLLSQVCPKTEEACKNQLRRGVGLMKRWAAAGERLSAAQAAILGAKSERAH